MKRIAATLLALAALASPAAAHGRHHHHYHKIVGEPPGLRVSTHWVRLNLTVRQVYTAAHPRSWHHYAQTHREGHREAFRDWGYERRSQARRPAHGARYVGGGGLIHVPTAAGITITVASSVAGKFQALIAAFVRAGYHPRHIGCYAARGHIPNSLHHSGEACDFDQTTWNRTAGFMYHAHALIVAAGLRDGCDFRHPRRDCGHVDDGRSIGYARHYRRHEWRSHYARM